MPLWRDLGGMNTRQLQREIARLVDATEHIIRGEADVVRQRAIVEDLISVGGDTTEARELLSELLNTLASLRADRDLIEGTMARLT